MNHAQRFLHADAGGYLIPICIASLPTVSKITSNSIRKAINACTDLSKGEKRMLGEVCTFVQVGKNGVCDATNAHFVNECLIAKDSVARILARLVTKELVTVDPGKEQGNKRLIWPTKKALAIYMTPEQMDALEAAENGGDLSTKVDTPIDIIFKTLSTFVDTPIDFLQGGLSTFSGEAIDFLRSSLLIVKERYINVVLKEEEGEAKTSSPATSIAKPEAKEKVTPQPANQHPVPGTEGRGPLGAADEVADATDADAALVLTSPDIFRSACLELNPAYADIDFEHYRLEILFEARSQQLRKTAYQWRKYLRHWLTNAKGSRAGLILAAVPGQTKGDPRAVKPLAHHSSAAPTQKKSWRG